MRLVRVLLGATGLVLIGVGLWYVAGIGIRDVSRLLGIAVWLAGGVVAHDAVVAPLVLVFGLLVLPRLPPWGRAALAGGLVVLLSVTLLALPVIGRFGARPDVPSLLDRPYGLLWLVFAGLVLVATVVAALLRRRAARP